MDFFQFSVPTKIIFAQGISKDFSAELEHFSARRYLVVTDQFLNQSGLVAPIIEGMKSAGFEIVGVFDEVPPDSGVGIIEKGAAFAKKNSADGIVAIGGGSVLDTAKGVNLLATLGGDLVNDYSGTQTINSPLNTLIAIPTTAGTGSEVTEAMVILDEKTQTKLSFVDSHLLPSLAILDPELTLGLPAKLTAATAMDALTHAIEATLSVQKSPVADALAYQAIALIMEALIPTVSHGQDREGRGKLLVASNLAGMAFNHAMVGVVHALAHTVGAVAHVHHGMANSILLPYGLEYNLPQRTAEIAALALVLGVAEQGSSLKTALACIKKIRDLRQKLKELCGLSCSLSEAGLKENQISLIAEKAPDDGASFYNPRPLTSEELLPFIQRAFSNL
ncbi:MAG: hypothetical protein A3G32_08060 [Deltaproteobacteria bacterium RIFCSPLOWO2_12_FULL_40_28]|nr:MAG: hypothetical protein A3C45_00760 [Deltaproteobacteria bacterium RIFCSPHIGHO2_02_FULL_40_28]OGQ20864.1 MAG: hypothetical protein A3E27_03425 [Deltaproteobacteria bacterium RIFCSPHIGHO2_12_FULL_40_32]OGQ39265.1 MAG: hypothetical protein A3I69_04785 [Deltaproteobacteria bacterium RIFCSPLOWO2_02_FULL_40_36]OGQ54546.1 MAG: hypothetical protein A3G32_08060 [Deltaproteobacteria bacterium RIFCSPLOWO2_12_FULL_40_28]